jgi:hypothetical protein
MPLFPHHTKFTETEVASSFPNKPCLLPTLGSRITEIATTYLASTSHKGKLFRLNTLGQICVDDKPVFDVSYELPEFLAGDTTTDGAGNGDYDLWFSWTGQLLKPGMAVRTSTGYSPEVNNVTVLLTPGMASRTPTAYSVASLMIDYGTVITGLQDGTVSYWNSGNSLPAGNYRAAYITGAWRPYYLNNNWTVQHSFAAVGPYIKYNGGAASFRGPGIVGDYGSSALAIAANTGRYTDFTHTGGSIGAYLYDTDYALNDGTGITIRLLKIS